MQQSCGWICIMYVIFCCYFSLDHICMCFFLRFTNFSLYGVEVIYLDVIWIYDVWHVLILIHVGEKKPITCERMWFSCEFLIWKCSFIFGKMPIMYENSPSFVKRQISPVTFSLAMIQDGIQIINVMVKFKFIFTSIHCATINDVRTFVNMDVQVRQNLISWQYKE